MSDRYQQLVNTPIGRIVTRQVGLPDPVPLERYEPGQAVITGPVLLVAAGGGGRLANAAASVLETLGAEVFSPGAAPGAAVFSPAPAAAEETFKALLFDATGIVSGEALRDAWEFFSPAIRRIRTCGRVIVLGTPPERCESPDQAIAHRALEGLTRSIGKEVRRGATAQLVYVEPNAEDEIESTLRFFLSPKSAHVSGQVVRIATAPASVDGLDWERPLTGRVALVTGAARGIGQAIAEVLARDGAHAVCVDLPAAGDDVAAVAAQIGGSSLTVDITAQAGPATIVSHLLDAHGGVDVVVHNAGVTRDRTLGRMTEDLWQTVIAANLIAPQRINRELWDREALRENGRIVCVSSISGIAGNAGQTNYATSKAGVIGIVEAFAPAAAQQRATINAVAPGFIETGMTAAMPIAVREAGRRMSSLAQGGLPVDVAETIPWLAHPASAGVNGNVVRVCGQSLLGA